MLGASMGKSAAAMLVLLFLTASCIIVAKPAFSSADTAEDTWVAKEPMHVARGGLGVAVVNGKIYAIGGSTVAGHAEATTGGIVGKNEEFDPATNTWTSKKPMPTPRYGFAIAVYNNKIFCIGGENRAGYTGANEVYDPATDTWETKTSSYPRYGISANVVGDEIYVVGGVTKGYFPTLNEVYYPENDCWTTKTPIPTPVCDYASAVFNKRIYIIQSTTQIYNVENDTWSLGASPLSSVTGRAGQTSGVNAPERIYALSWHSGVNQIYDPEHDSWTLGANAPIPTDMGGFSIAVVKDFLYLIGGSTLTYDPDIFPTSPLAAISTKYALNKMYTPVGYGTVPPIIDVVSPVNQMYNRSSVSLVFTVNKQVNWTGYSLDGEDNVTVAGNMTLSGLPNGAHNLTVYATDQYGNTGASETVDFTVDAPVPFPVVRVAAASGVAITGAAVCVFHYRKKRNH
jgi:hypothetical protein